MSLNGTFEPDDKDGETWKYSVADWIDAYGKHHDGSTFTEWDMAHTDFAVFQTTDMDGHVHYVTLYGPWNDRDEIEASLAYDFGTEGSLAE